MPVRSGGFPPSWPMPHRPVSVNGWIPGWFGGTTTIGRIRARPHDPLLRKFFCVVSVRPRFMPKKFSKLSDVLLGCCEASLDMNLEHDPKVIRKPARCARLPQLLYKSVEVGVPCVTDLFLKNATPGGRGVRTAEQVLRNQVVGFACITILCQRDCSRFGNIANINRRNTGVAERHRIQSWPMSRSFSRASFCMK